MEMTPDTDQVAGRRTDDDAAPSEREHGAVPVPRPRTGPARPPGDDAATAGPEDDAPTGEFEPEPDGEPDGEPEPEDDEDLDPGPLRGDVLGRIAGATTAVLATADRDGTQDVSVLAGARCFLRVLDRNRFAFPDTGVEPLTAARANLAETPGVAMLLLVGGTRRALHLNGTARVVPAAELRAEDPTVPEAPVPGESTDVWVVVEVGDLYPLDGEEAPVLGGPRPVPPPAPGGAPIRGRTVAAALVAVALIAMVALAAVVIAQRPSAPAAAPTAAPGVDTGPTGPPTLRGQVTDVRDPATVVVDVAGRPVTVAIVGLDAASVPACAAPASLDFARRTLQGQTVTLVPDPTLPQQPGVTRAYAVLGTQLSYTDAAIRQGHAPVAGPTQYRAVYDGEQRDAQDDGAGMWGPPCVG
jgi:endonuclease YncB( thermonuclease family)